MGVRKLTKACQVGFSTRDKLEKTIFSHNLKSLSHDVDHKIIV
jgi:hypothetical protein